MAISIQQVIALAFFLFNATVVVAGTNEAGLAFLAENKDKPGVISLPSGLQYKVLKKGKGLDHPTQNAPCSCHYEGKLINGEIFDSSYGRGEPTTFAPNQVIKGWTEAMQLMVAGDKWELYIPSDLAYGDRGSPPRIGGGEVLIFQMEILAIMGDVVPALQCKIDTKERCNEKEQGYITKVQGWYDSGETTKASEQLARVQKILGSPMKDDLREWGRRRVHILEQFVEKETAEAEL